MLKPDTPYLKRTHQDLEKGVQERREKEQYDLTKKHLAKFFCTMMLHPVSVAL